MLLFVFHASVHKTHDFGFLNKFSDVRLCRFPCGKALPFRSRFWRSAAPPHGGRATNNQSATESRRLSPRKAAKPRLARFFGCGSAALCLRGDCLILDLVYHGRHRGHRDSTEKKRRRSVHKNFSHSLRMTRSSSSSSALTLTRGGRTGPPLNPTMSINSFIVETS